MQDNLIVVSQLPVITQHLNLVAEEIKQKTETAKSLVCTADTLKAVKGTRAELNKDFSSLEEMRKAVKTAVMAPYNEFEGIYKACVTDAFKEADGVLRAKISEVEDGLKSEKEEAVKAYFDEYKTVCNVHFLQLSDAKLNITRTASLKSLKESCKAFIEKVVNEMNFIVKQFPDSADEMLFEYRHTLSLDYAVNTVTNRKKALEQEAEARRAAEQKQKENKAHAEEVEQIAALNAPKVVVSDMENTTPTVSIPEIVEAKPETEKVYQLVFKVWGTKDQLKTLKQFLKDGGYQYE